VQKSRIPLFTLAAALRNPTCTRAAGSWFAARSGEIRRTGNKAAAIMRETSLRATAHEVQDGSISRVDRTSQRSRVAEGAEPRRYGKRSRERAVQLQRPTEYSTVEAEVRERARGDGPADGGQAPAGGPFLEPEKDFSYLARSMGESGPGPAAGRDAFDRRLLPAERPAHPVKEATGPASRAAASSAKAFRPSRRSR